LQVQRSLAVAARELAIDDGQQPYVARIMEARIMTILRSTPCWLLLLVAAGSAHAQEPTTVSKIVLPSLDSQVAARMVALDRRLNPVHSPQLAAALVGQSLSPLDALTPLFADERNRESWELMPDDYHRMSQESGDALVSLPTMAPEFGVAWSSGQVRMLCHRRLASLPRASLEIYRRRVDAEAKVLLDEGRKSRSPIPLRKLVDELFCSTSGDQALDLLGDLAFERGDFEEASYWWRQLVLFPRPSVDMPRVEAKQVLALIFEGRLDDAKGELGRFANMHPSAKGSLAGQTDVYAGILKKALTTFTKQRPSNNDEPWTTFGGDPTRARNLSYTPSRKLWEDGLPWRAALPSLAPKGKDALPDRGTLRRGMAFHPVIVNDQVLIADHRSVVSYHLITGKELFRFDLKTAGLYDPGPGIDKAAKLPRFTLSVDGDRAYVRLGRVGVTPKTAVDASYLVCLDLTQPERDKKRELWHVEAKADDHSQAFFEGSPIVHDGRVYIGLSKIVGQRVVTSIVCHDVRGRCRWTREVCDCPEFEETSNGFRDRQHLLTLAAGQIVYCSHAGAIVAVDEWTGQPTWGVRYPSRGTMTAEHVPSPRDLAPALYADGRVYAAPLDTDRVFCIDAFNGRVYWELDGSEVVHLHGIANGRLVATTRDGVASIETATGLLQWKTYGRLPSLGRGLIAGDWLIQPTQDGYRVVGLREGRQQADGESPLFNVSMLSSLPMGNMAFGQGCLAIAGLNELVVYVPPQRLHQLPPVELGP
jgi:cellulose synthase operon protein C